MFDDQQHNRMIPFDEVAWISYELRDVEFISNEGEVGCGEKHAGKARCVYDYERNVKTEAKIQLCIMI